MSIILKCDKCGQHSDPTINKNDLGWGVLSCSMTKQKSTYTLYPVFHKTDFNVCPNCVKDLEVRLDDPGEQLTREELIMQIVEDLVEEVASRVKQ